MTTANPQQQQPTTLFHKFSTEVRPHNLERQGDRIPMTCSFEDIVESEEEDIQLPEQTSTEGRSPFAVAFESPFAERRESSSRNPTPGCARNVVVPRLCRSHISTFFGTLSPERYVAGPGFLALAPIPETASS